MGSRSSFIARHSKQTAVYWANAVDNRAGGWTFDAPVEVSVRWEDRAELYRDAKGEEAVSNAVVFVGQDMAIGEFLFLGALADVTAAQQTDPLKLDSAYQIGATEKIPNVRNDIQIRKVFLGRVTA